MYATSALNQKARLTTKLSHAGPMMWTAKRTERANRRWLERMVRRRIIYEYVPNQHDKNKRKSNRTIS